MTKQLLIQDNYANLELYHEPQEGILWYFMRPEPRPCFTPGLLQDIRRVQERVTRLFYESHQRCTDIRYLVMASSRPGYFSLGGDLNLFYQLITRRDREGLTRYARACIDALHPLAVHLNVPLTTVSLVQGNALGGGFEAALATNVLIAERSARMGLPEILFNLFPGMGAFSFLSRRLDPARAQRMILSGRNYSAEELYDMGLVDVLAEDGEGVAAVHDYVRRQERYRNGILAVHAINERLNPVTYEELIEVSMVWVDAALRLEARDLKVMERLVRAQNRVSESEQAALRLDVA